MKGITFTGQKSVKNKFVITNLKLKAVMKLSVGIIILLLSFCCKRVIGQGVKIANGDGTVLTTEYCHSDTSFTIVGEPAGGVFSGCGVVQENGSWYFSPATAAAGVELFPYKCRLSYVLNDDTASELMIINKPVSVFPSLRDSFTCDGHFNLLANLRYAGDYLYTWEPANPLVRPDTSLTDGYIEARQHFVFTAVDVTTGCEGSDSLIIERHEAPVLIVSNDTLINARGQVQLSAAGADQYQWSPNTWLDQNSGASPTAAPEAPITYTVIGFNEYGCSDTASVRIGIHEDFYIPTAFSPNYDGVNDVFRIKNFGYEHLLGFEVFNRWGQIVFTTTDGTRGWDGNYNGQPAAASTYYYLIRIASNSRTITTIKGDVILVR